MSPCEPQKIDHSMNHPSQNQINKTTKIGPLPRHITDLHEQLKPPCLVSYSSKCQWYINTNLLALSYITFLTLCCQVARTVEFFFLELECLSVLLAHKKNLHLYCKHDEFISISISTAMLRFYFVAISFLFGRFIYNGENALCNLSWGIGVCSFQSPLRHVFHLLLVPYHAYFQCPKSKSRNKARENKQRKKKRYMLLNSNRLVLNFGNTTTKAVKMLISDRIYNFKIKGVQ